MGIRAGIFNQPDYLFFDAASSSEEEAVFASSVHEARVKIDKQKRERRGT